MYIRGRSDIGATISADGGKSFGDAFPSEISNPNSRFAIRRTPSGRLLLVNHAIEIEPEKQHKPLYHVRDKLTAYLSDDDGATYPYKLMLDERVGVSYPDVAFVPDGTIHVIYDYNRYTDKEILCARITEADIVAGELIGKTRHFACLSTRRTDKNDISTERINIMENLKARNENMREFFDRKVEGYDDIHAKFAGTKAALTTVLADDTKKVLDLGAGTGMELIPLYERFPEVKVTAVDISAPMLETLKKREFADKVECIAGDFFEVDFGTDFDAMISTSALHHFDEEDKLRLYKKVFDALKPGGIFANSDKIADDQATQDEWLGYWRNSPDMMHHIDTPLTPENERKLLIAAGFVNVVIESTDAEDYRLMTGVKPM